MLLEEIQEVATLCAEDDRWAAYLPMIVDELAEARQAEAGYLARDPRLRASVDALISSISSDGKTPGLLNERARIARTLFGDVQDRWKAHAQELARSDGREKVLFLHRLSTLATHVLSRGLEQESLATLSAESIFAGPAAFVDLITACVSGELRKFECVVALEGGRGDLAALIANSSFSQVGKGRGIRQDERSRAWHVAHGERFFVSKPYSALSRRLAAETCLQEISTLLNVHNLYHNSAAVKAVAPVLVYDEAHRPFTVEVSPEKYFGLFPRSEYRRLTRETYAQVGPRLEGRLSNALECHTLALDAEHPKTAMINLWTALETITGFMGPKATGMRVADRIAPLIAYRRVDKIATYLALSIHATMQEAELPIDPGHLPGSSKEFIAPDDVLRAVTGREGNGPILYLFEACSTSPLLVNRLYTVWQQFHEPKSLAASLARSKRRVEWQIARIYRARNLLVHRGEESRYTGRLLRNAHYYVSSAISRVLHDLREQPRWSVDTSLVHQSQRYDGLYDDLMTRDGHSVAYSDLLVQKTRSADARVWS